VLGGCDVVDRQVEVLGKFEYKMREQFLRWISDHGEGNRAVPDKRNRAPNCNIAPTFSS